MARALLLVAAVASVSSLSACYSVAPSRGGGQVPSGPQAPKNPGDVALPAGYAVTLVATGLTFPTGVALDDEGRPYVVEAGYSYGEKVTTARLLRIEPDGSQMVVASGKNNGPWNGVAFAKGAFFVAEGGELRGGRILKIGLDGTTKVLVSDLPSLGDHHTDGPVVGPDGYVYFGQGTATNSGVVGPDNAEFGWLPRHPDFHDVPCKDIELTGVNFKSTSTLPGAEGEVETGAYSPYGTPTRPGQVIAGMLPCNGAVLRVPAAGGPLELVAWGFRNPFGLAFSPDQKLFVTENGFDERGSRPVFGAADVLWEIVPGAWYGWPDHAEGKPVSTRRFQPPGKEPPPQLIKTPPGTPPKPVAIFGVHSSANGFDFSRNPAFGHEGEAFVAMFGDMAPGVGKVFGPVGFKVVRVDPKTGVVDDFATNRGSEPGPASRLHTGGLERPVAVRFDAAGTSLYVVDFGILSMTETGPAPQESTGALWKITRVGAK
jgi:glucose/arabinose dehydrogenase